MGEGRHRYHYSPLSRLIHCADIHSWRLRVVHFCTADAMMGIGPETPGIMDTAAALVVQAGLAGEMNLETC